MINDPVPFPAGVVGSMPRSQFVRDLLDPDRTPEDPSEFSARMDASVDYVLALQEAAGLDVVSDGEYRRRSYIGIIADVADGFVRERKEGLWWHTVVAPVVAKRTGLAAAEAEYLRARTQKAIKVCLPSPYLLGQRMWHRERSRDAYPTREAFMQALVTGPSGRTAAAPGRGRRYSPVRRSASLSVRGSPRSRKIRRPRTGDGPLRGSHEPDCGWR